MGLILILILSLFLRLYNLNQSLWLDESVSAIVVTRMWDLWIPMIYGDFHPPLFHLILHAWTGIFGSTEIALRLPSVLFGVGSVFFIYLLAKEIGGKKPAIISSIFLATAPYHIYYSQEARMYSMVTFFSLVSVYTFWKVLKEGNRWWIFYILATILAVYSDYFAFLVLAFQNIWFLVRARCFETSNLKFRIKPWLISQVVILLSFLPWLPTFLKQLETGIWATNLLPGWADLVNLSVFKALPLTFAKFSFGRITFEDKMFYGGIILLVFIFYSMLALKAFSKEKKSTFFVLEYLGVPVLLALVVSMFTPFYQPFRLLLVIPAFYLLLALGVAAFSKIKWQIVTTVLVLAVNIYGLSLYYTDAKFWREDWRGAVNYIETKDTRNALTILPSYTSKWPYIYYAKKTPYLGVVELKATREEIVQRLEKEAKDKNQTFYIDYLQPLFDPQNEIRNWLTKSGFTKKDIKNFNGVTVEEYQK